ncbi:unnamed protein product (mitochondrion) [Plasmodiophora brassicae]|uniref:Tetratricopeptide repeat protein n=1 Tax=Plasmodiophora brassicae TaxID=37360 RepID=A0A0G4IIS3_PLABS|nr:hypothetical protein PBRA_003840 [Plasmodiophora brassicae]SPQ94355.1 unnamed protein product [Plasmodiophora brassicae]
MTSIMERGMTDKERKVLARELDWFSVEFNRASKRPRDLLNEAKQQFTDGKFESSITILQIYLRMPKGMEDNVSAAFHLLGHCYLRLGMADKAQQFFIASISSGYENDWQTLVEVEVDMAVKEGLGVTR